MQVFDWNELNNRMKQKEQGRENAQRILRDVNDDLQT
jgi:hypothetical protein